MTRLLILVTIVLSIVSFASAQVVETLNTPAGPITQGVTTLVTWTLQPNADATGKTGTLTATDSTTKNTITIDSAVPLAPMTYMWNVSVPPGNYNLGLNDGSGVKQSGSVEIVAASGAPLVSGTPATSSGTLSSASSTPTPSAQTPPASPPAIATTTPGTTPGTTPSTGTPTSPSASSTPTGTLSLPTQISKNSASSIFSGYDNVFSLLCVAITMIQFYI